MANTENTSLPIFFNYVSFHILGEFPTQKSPVPFCYDCSCAINSEASSEDMQSKLQVQLTIGCTVLVKV